jgi:hypothetical protein
MDRLANKTVSTDGVGSTTTQPVSRRSIDLLANVLTRVGLLREDAEYHLLRAAMVGTLLFLGFWNKRLGILGALGSTATFVGTVTIIPFMPEGWDAAAGGFPAMTGNVPFLMKDVVLLAVSVYLLKQDVRRVVRATGTIERAKSSGRPLHIDAKAG